MRQREKRTVHEKIQNPGKGDETDRMGQQKCQSGRRHSDDLWEARGSLSIPSMRLVVLTLRPALPVGAETGKQLAGLDLG